MIFYQPLSLEHSCVGSSPHTSIGLVIAKFEPQAWMHAVGTLLKMLRIIIRPKTVHRSGCRQGVPRPMLSFVKRGKGAFGSN